MEQILKGLNVAQRAAVTCPASVLQVLAPPGSGKTKTLTSRVAYLLAHHGYAPRNVICCTFTIKASREMRERLRGLVGEDLESKLILGTFHSVCRRYLATYGHLIGLPKQFGIADSDDSLGILKRIQKRLNLGIDPRVARSKISHRKARGKRLEDVSQSKIKSQDAKEFQIIFREYEDALAGSNLLDYDDLLLRCVDLLQQHPECVSNVEAILIDEFQDTNVIQFELMKLLAWRKKRITIVGDPDQSIYGFRSAEIENLHRMRDYYSDTVVINLEENYRSSSAILQLAQDVIEQDNDRPDKKLKATHCHGTLPVLRKLPNQREEALWIASEIKRLVKMTASLLEHSDVAILVRSAFLSMMIEKALANLAIPYRMVGGRRFFDRVEVRLVLDYLRTINHPDNNSALISIINTPSRKVGDTTLAELTKLAESKKISMWTTLQKVLTGELTMAKKLSKPAEQGLRSFVTLIRKGQNKLDAFESKEAPRKLIELIIHEIGLNQYLKKLYPEDFEERWENVQELANQASEMTFENMIEEDQLPQVEGVEQLVVNGGREILARFLANVALSTEVETDDVEKKSCVTISTIHSAKGLEWPVVFIPAIYEGSIPHSRAEDTNEERRLLYVAMTRAQALLYLTFPVHQSRDNSESIPTQFLPATLEHRLSDIGSGLDDRVIGDIASILQRPLPTQEALAKAAASIEGNESQYDDVWPANGLHRKTYHDDKPIHEMTIESLGQSMTEIFNRHAVPDQKREYSTTAGFTTATHQLSIMPQQKLESDNSVGKSQKSTKIDSSNQGNLAMFFAKGTFTPTLESKPVSNALYLQAKSTRTEPIVPQIPREFSGHRIASGFDLNGSYVSKRPRPVLEETSLNEVRHRKRQYTFLSSSPPLEGVEDCPQSKADIQTASVSVENSPKVATSNTKSNEATRTTIMHRTSTTMKTTISAMSQPTSTFLSAGMQRQSYASGMLNTLQKPPLLSSTSMSTELGPTRKTLGVRRSMNGWADRKHR